MPPTVHSWDDGLTFTYDSRSRLISNHCSICCRILRTSCLRMGRSYNIARCTTHLYMLLPIPLFELNFKWDYKWSNYSRGTGFPVTTSKKEDEIWMRITDV